ncbi:MAG: hypothetical protein KIT84_38685 [Labilithrix sp.]|nr:hypothetical protein [Labilithrix sp.]MCW5816988.1 hypothetical protein [Labilithrix sp.]
MLLASTPTLVLIVLTACDESSSSMHESVDAGHPLDVVRAPEPARVDASVLDGDGGARDDAATAPDASPDVVELMDGGQISAVSFVVAPRMQADVSVPLLEGELVEILSAPAGIETTVDAGTIRLRLSRVFTAGAVTYRALSNGSSRSGRLDVRADTSSFATIDGELYRVREVASDKPSTPGARLGLWSGSDARAMGTWESASTTSSVLIEGGALQFGGPGTAFRHADATTTFGSRDGRPAWYEGGAWTTLPWGDAAGSLFDRRHDWHAAAVRDATRFGDDELHAVRCSTASYADCARVGPDDATESEAHAVDTTGRVVGCGKHEGHRRPFTSVGDAGTGAWEPTGLHGCFHGFRDDGSIVGEVTEPDGELRALHVGTSVARIVFARRLGGWLAGGRGGLFGGTIDYGGHLLAAKLEPWPSIVGVSLQEAPEPQNPALAHACGHGESGPFSTLVASATPAEAPTFRRSHTFYTIARPPLVGDPAFIALDNTVDGELTLHFQEPIAVRMTGPNGHDVPIDFADRTGRCPVLRQFVQFHPHAVGRHVIELGPGRSANVHMVYERGSSVEP